MGLVNGFGTEPQIRAELQDAILPALGNLARAGINMMSRPQMQKCLLIY